MNPSAANSQSAAFSCQSYQEGYATIARSSLGNRPIIIWDARQPFCETISRRFQAARDNGTLRFIVTEENRVCGTETNGGGCRTLLFATDTPMNAQSLWRRLINNDSISGRYITQNNGIQYFDFESYINEVPILPNQ